MEIGSSVSKQSHNNYWGAPVDQEHIGGLIRSIEGDVATVYFPNETIEIKLSDLRPQVWPRPQFKLGTYGFAQYIVENWGPDGPIPVIMPTMISQYTVFTKLTGNHWPDDPGGWSVQVQHNDQYIIIKEANFWIWDQPDWARSLPNHPVYKVIDSLVYWSSTAARILRGEEWTETKTDKPLSVKQIDLSTIVLADITPDGQISVWTPKKIAGLDYTKYKDTPSPPREVELQQLERANRQVREPLEPSDFTDFRQDYQGRLPENVNEWELVAPEEEALLDQQGLIDMVAGSGGQFKMLGFGLLGVGMVVAGFFAVGGIVGAIQSNINYNDWYWAQVARNNDTWLGKDCWVFVFKWWQTNHNPDLDESGSWWAGVVTKVILKGVGVKNNHPEHHITTFTIDFHINNGQTMTIIVDDMTRISFDGKPRTARANPYMWDREVAMGMREHHYDLWDNLIKPFDQEPKYSVNQNVLIIHNQMSTFITMVHHNELGEVYYNVNLNNSSYLETELSLTDLTTLENVDQTQVGDILTDGTQIAHVGQIDVDGMIYLKDVGWVDEWWATTNLKVGDYVEKDGTFGMIYSFSNTIRVVDEDDQLVGDWLPTEIKPYDGGMNFYIKLTYKQPKEFDDTLTIITHPNGLIKLSLSVTDAYYLSLHIDQSLIYWDGKSMITTRRRQLFNKSTTLGLIAAVTPHLFDQPLESVWTTASTYTTETLALSTSVMLYWLVPMRFKTIFMGTGQALTVATWVLAQPHILKQVLDEFYYPYLQPDFESSTAFGLVSAQTPLKTTLATYPDWHYDSESPYTSALGSLLFITTLYTFKTYEYLKDYDFSPAANWLNQGVATVLGIDGQTTEEIRAIWPQKLAAFYHDTTLLKSLKYYTSQILADLYDSVVSKMTTNRTPAFNPIALVIPVLIFLLNQ